MAKKEKFILMCRNDEVLSFTVAFKEKSEVKVIDKLARFDLAPYGMNKEGVDLDRMLNIFLSARTISGSRWDYEEIIKAIGCIDLFELSFKGYGLSLSDHYWYKRSGEELRYEDINFFTNKWDDSFARAVLSGRYEELKNVDLNVPDVVTPGWSIKGWLYEDGPKLYKLGLVKDHFEDCLGEVLGSRLARRILNKEEVLEYKLTKIYGKYASVSSPMIGIDEELISLFRILPRELFNLYSDKNRDKTLNKEFFSRIKEFGLPDLYELFVKITCLRDLCFIPDLHFGNISMIKNLNTGEMRAAPIYDLAGSFGTSQGGRDFAMNLGKGSYALIYFFFNGLEPDWDYSWYDPKKLEGFEDEIVDILSKSDFYTPELIEKVTDVYRNQKKTLDEMSGH